MKYYSKYLIIFIVSLVAGFVFHLALFCFNFGVPNAQEKYLNEWFEKKDAYASSITGSKIMFISGSNTLFGVDTQKIEKELDIPTVNYGTHAGLSYYTLHRAQKYLYSGDIVILPLEYEFFTRHKNENEIEFTFFILGYDPMYFRNYSLISKLLFISHASTNDLLKLSIKRFLPTSLFERAYGAKYLNSNGDMTHYTARQSNANELLLAKVPDKVFGEPPLIPDSQEELTNFINYCHENNITILAAWPNYLWKEKSFSGDDLAGIHAIEDFYHQHNVEILGNYTDCLYDVDLFYDSTYHLNAEGKRIHSEYMIQLLRDKVHK